MTYEIDWRPGAVEDMAALFGVSLDIENYCTVSLFFEQTYL